MHATTLPTAAIRLTRRRTIKSHQESAVATTWDGGAGDSSGDLPGQSSGEFGPDVQMLSFWRDHTTVPKPSTNLVVPLSVHAIASTNHFRDEGSTGRAREDGSTAPTYRQLH